MKIIKTAIAFLPAILLLANTTSPAWHNPLGFSQKFVATSLITSKYVNEHNNNYFEWNLQSFGLSKPAFDLAIKGYQVLEQEKALHRSNLLTIIDYSLPSSKKRLFVLDMQKGKIVFNTLVAHGRNSGAAFANSFSNETASYQTSLGFYITLGTYIGENGYSLKLKGCEKDINDNAFERAIVLHGAEYVSQDFLHHHGYLGRSYGCPAIPINVTAKIIDKIKNGSCMFLYHPTKNYTTQSKILGS